MSPRVTILSGAGRYADPWHPFAETSAAIAQILGDDGYEVRIREDVDAALADAALTDAAPTDAAHPAAIETDLLVVNVGRPGPRDAQGRSLDTSDDPTADAGARAGLLATLRRGTPLLAFHVSATSFPAVPEWERILGGIWVRGTTMHPPRGHAHIRVTPRPHPVSDGLHDFDVEDERYSFLRVSPDVRRLAWHEWEGNIHPLVWAHDYEGTRVVYDALGHDAASFHSPEHRALVRGAARWLTAS